MAEQTNVFSDRYELVRHVARGGMAQVYLAHDLLLDRDVALKALFPELSVDQNFVERFRREAKAAANLSHPNIVSVYDWGQGENTYYIVMEFVDGPTLSAMLREGPLEPQRAAAIASSVAAALDFAHRRGVIHRDVKPGNVLIDSRSQVKVADFGIARATGASNDLTQTGSVMGTATYFSPEQAQGYSVDARSDVYSLGVVLYEMVVGRPPFSGENPVSIAYKHVKEQAVRPTQANPEVPPALEAVIMKALSKEPADRYQSAEEMRADLVRYLNGERVQAAAVAPATTVMGAVGGDPTLMQTRIGGGGGDATSMYSATRAGGPPPEDRSRAALYTLIALVIVALALAGYFGGKQAGLFGASAKTLTVPSGLGGQPVADAQSKLSQLGFTNVKTQPQNSSSVSNGDVISTNPPGGTQMKSDSPLTLVVSSGAIQVTVPDVKGKAQLLADQALTAAGFKPNDVPTYSSTVDKGTVISTNPPGGQQANQGSTVQVMVSNGVQPVTVPSVTGDSPAVAGQVLGSSNLQVGQTLTEASTSVKAGLVTRTNPPAGTSVKAGSSVTVYVSSGLPQTTVPDMTGYTQSQASAALSQANLQASFTTVAVTSQSQDGLVQSQNPTGGQTADQGSTVTVAIGQYSGPSTTTSTSNTTTTTTTTVATNPLG